MTPNHGGSIKDAVRRIEQNQEGFRSTLDAHGQVLYVGTSRNLRSRVRTYFTAAETRRRVLDMLPRAESIRTIECTTESVTNCQKT